MGSGTLPKIVIYLTRTMRSYLVKENHNGLAVSEILWIDRYTVDILLLLYKNVNFCLPNFLETNVVVFNALGKWGQLLVYLFY